ncbi:hypothetical protein PRVXH_000685 [Proteinivorax hydrogeniformans]|uniref:ATLF-like domain-containing protein n=1 Tax=Proteinivorax hydrogeniformans TaxID=1826727 RepID=A0AAU8HVH2_9FIRM
MSNQKIPRKRRTLTNNIHKFRKKTLIIAAVVLFSALIIGGSFSGAILYGYGASNNIYYGDGSIKFNGDIVNGVPNGEGVLYSENGAKIAKGYFKDGRLNGPGKLYRNSDALYKGEFKNGLPHGAGNSFYTNGQLKYEGYWQKGLKHGQGKLFNQDGELLYVGEMESNTFHGDGKYYQSDQLIYKGHWKKHARHGQGKEFNGENLVYEGQWSQNYYSCEGRYFVDGSLIYEGAWDFGLPNGLGTLYSDDDKFYKGKWVDGKILEGQFYNQDEVAPALSNVITDKVHHDVMMLQIQDFTLTDIFYETVEGSEKYYDDFYHLSKVIEPASNDDDFKYTMYDFIEVPDGNYNQHLVTNSIKEMERIPLEILKDLTSIGVSHRFIYGHIGNQPEFSMDHATTVGTLREVNPVGLSSYKDRLLVTRLDQPNPYMTALHEIGHAVDHFLLSRVSDTEEFKEIFNKEASKLFYSPWYDLSYYTDRADEYFAEGFASYYINENRGSGYTPTRDEIAQNAPKTYSFFNESVDNYQNTFRAFNSKMAVTANRDTNQLKNLYEHDYNYHIYSLDKRTLSIDNPTDFDSLVSFILKEGITHRPLNNPDSIYLIMTSCGQFFINTNEINIIEKPKQFKKAPIKEHEVEKNSLLERFRGGYHNFMSNVRE